MDTASWHAFPFFWVPKAHHSIVVSGPLWHDDVPQECLPLPPYCKEFLRTCSSEFHQISAKVGHGRSTDSPAPRIMPLTRR